VDPLDISNWIPVKVRHDTIFHNLISSTKRHATYDWSKRCARYRTKVQWREAGRDGGRELGGGRGVSSLRTTPVACRSQFPISLPGLFALSLCLSVRIGLRVCMIVKDTQVMPANCSALCLRSSMKPYPPSPGPSVGNERRCDSREEDTPSALRTSMLRYIPVAPSTNVNSRHSGTKHPCDWSRRIKALPLGFR
jgi:hypothetical protein